MDTTLTTPAIMKAAVARRYGPPETVQVIDVPRPTPGPEEVLVRNSASVVTHAIVEARRGPLMARLYFGLFTPKWPVLGTNFAGTVTEVGSSVTRFAVGDRVAGINVVSFGAHAEYVSVPEAGVIVPSPAGLSDIETVAALDGSITALPFLRDRARIGSGQSILINGAAGAVGSAAVQLAKYYGAVVTAVCSAENTQAVRRLGADRVIDYAKEDFTDARDTYDIVFDAVGKSSFARCRRSLTLNGHYMTTVPSLGILAHTAWSSRFGRRKASILFTGLARPAEMLANLAFLHDLIEQGALVPFVGSVRPLSEVEEAHRLVETGHKRGSAVIALATQRHAPHRLSRRPAN